MRACRRLFPSGRNPEVRHWAAAENRQAECAGCDSIRKNLIAENEHDGPSHPSCYELRTNPSVVAEKRQSCITVFLMFTPGDSRPAGKCLSYRFLLCGDRWETDPA